MSRGHGKIERLVLEALGWNGQRWHNRMGLVTTVTGLALYIRAAKATGNGRNWMYDFVHGEDGRPILNNRGQLIRREPPPFTRSELESIRRALRNLHRQGLLHDPARKNYNMARAGLSQEADGRRLKPTSPAPSSTPPCRSAP
jgi:hypothetical protein